MFDRDITMDEAAELFRAQAINVTGHKQRLAISLPEASIQKNDRGTYSTVAFDLKSNAPASIESRTFKTLRAAVCEILHTAGHGPKPGPEHRDEPGSQLLAPLTPEEVVNRLRKQGFVVFEPIGQGGRPIWGHIVGGLPCGEKRRDPELRLCGKVVADYCFTIVTKYDAPGYAVRLPSTNPLLSTMEIDVDCLREAVELVLIRYQGLL